MEVNRPSPLLSFLPHANFLSGRWTTSIVSSHPFPSSPLFSLPTSPRYLFHPRSYTRGRRYSDCVQCARVDNESLTLDRVRRLEGKNRNSVRKYDAQRSVSIRRENRLRGPSLPAVVRDRSAFLPEWQTVQVSPPIGCVRKAWIISNPSCERIRDNYFLILIVSAPRNNLVPQKLERPFEKIHPKRLVLATSAFKRLLPPSPPPFLPSSPARERNYVYWQRGRGRD